MSLIKNRSLKQLTWIGIGSIVMFFAGLTSAYVVRKPQGNWIEFVLPNWFLYSTIIIVISSIFLIIANSRFKQQIQSFNFVLYTFFEKKLWPDFTIKDYNKILNNFRKTKRNFGKI